MILQLAIGTLIVVLNTVIQAQMFAAFSRRFETVLVSLRRRFHRFANTAAIIVGVLFVMLVITVQVWVWAVTFLATGALHGMEPALYFTLISFTTAGVGDVVLTTEWRLLSGITVANGFLSFGWCTAYLVEILRRTA